jgi:hypothetical protein
VLVWALVAIVTAGATIAVLRFAVGSRHGREGCLGYLLKLAMLAAGATILARPVGVPFLVGIPGLTGPQEAAVLTGAAPLVALLIAWWFGPYAPGGPGLTIVIRAAVLFGACLTTALLARKAGLPVMTSASSGATVALATTLLCIVTWRLADELDAPQLAVRAGVCAGAAAGVAVLAGANGVRLGTSSGGAAPWATLLVVTLLVFAGCLLVAAGARLLDRVLPDRPLIPGLPGAGRRPGVRMWPPRPGQVWNAFVPYGDDHSDGKDRPVLVVRGRRDSAEVMKITSQDQSGFDSHVYLPHRTWRRVLTRDSWLDLRPVDVPVDNFRSYRGQCLREVWREVGRRADGGRAARRGPSRQAPVEEYALADPKPPQRLRTLARRWRGRRTAR